VEGVTIKIDASWIEVPIAQFKELLEGVNWYRDGMGDVDRYFERHTKRKVGATDAKRTRAWVNLKFFSKA
jgi:hypothetical protein